ncbi:MAG: hypothetical protein HRU46_01165 [Verrucomicrobiales bacterium]|nr:hypothetical protein [Verrucomicrobiales bacterium]
MGEPLPACPYLPEVTEALRASALKALGSDRGPTFYQRALECGQSLWQQGLPAQSMLMMNRAFAADLAGDEPVLSEWPLPYLGMKWVMQARLEDQFIGNPRRHFQHLATRMVEPRKELRSWRAWGCWWLSCQVFPDYPADAEQIKNEGVLEPSFGEIEENLARVGWDGEVEIWRDATRPFPGS